MPKSTVQSVEPNIADLLLAYDSYGTAYPVLIEYKGYKDKLVKLDDNGNVAIKTADNKNDYKNINSYAVNGAVHYANALLHYTDYASCKRWQSRL